MTRLPLILTEADTESLYPLYKQLHQTIERKSGVLAFILGWTKSRSTALDIVIVTHLEVHLFFLFVFAFSSHTSLDMRLGLVSGSFHFNHS